MPGPSAFFCVIAFLAVAATLSEARREATQISWPDTEPIRERLESRGVTETSFPAFIVDLARANRRRVREGDLDHLVFYMLQSKRFTSLPAIEPALSARALVEGFDAAGREAFLRDPQTASTRVPAGVRERIAALIPALDADPSDARLAYFRDLTAAVYPDRSKREAGLVEQYLRVMRFVYEKEFVAPRSVRGPAAVAELYRDRGLSTDTAVEAGYLVSIGLGVARSLDSTFRVRRALVVGPGLDLAPRTALQEEGPPESYQPWAVLDALISLGLSRLDDLTLVAADINPRVVRHLQRAVAAPPVLTLVSEIRGSETVRLSEEYRRYVAELGRGIGEREPPPSGSDAVLRTRVRVNQAAARSLQAATLDIVTERLTDERFDLIVATNILPYFGDTELALAVTNISAMLAPGGVFLHNEARPVLGDLTTALGMPFVQSRHATIASVKGAPAPLFDSVWLHRRAW